MGGRWTTTSSVCLTVSIWGNIIRFSFASPELEFLPDLLQPLVKREISIWRQEQGSPSVQTCFTFYADLFHITFIPYNIICWGVFLSSSALSYRTLIALQEERFICIESHCTALIQKSKFQILIPVWDFITKSLLIIVFCLLTLEVGETNQTFTILGTNSNSHQTIKGNK